MFEASSGAELPLGMRFLVAFLPMWLASFCWTYPTMLEQPFGISNALVRGQNGNVRGIYGLLAGQLGL